MMDKKSANGFQTKASEAGIQRKQLPYSVETPYGFHLDLDFLKYVDDIEKGNTIKKVHIQRRVKGPPKFSTLPRNFSLPGHGVRPVPREKDSTWSGTSTLGPKPKSRVTEVQQIFDFRASEGGTSGQSSRGTSSQGSAFVTSKLRDEVARGVEDKNVGIQSRPNLLRASSMPITLQQRKGSDSSSPDRTLGTPENGSTENMFRASPDITERRCVPQDRAGLHQQITVALKRVRELEEQVKTIPELKAQICSLREEREQLLIQLQAKAKAQVSTSSSKETASHDARTKSQSQGQRPPGGLNLPLITQTTGDLKVVQPVQVKPATRKERQGETEPADSMKEEESSSAWGDMVVVLEQRLDKEAVSSEQINKQKDSHENIIEIAAQKLSDDITGQAVTSCKVAAKETYTQDGQTEDRKLEDSESMHKLQEKLILLEEKLTQASQELERTNSLLKEQLEENKVKDERILQLREGKRVELGAAEIHDRPRRESIDAGTVTERVDFANQETETDSPGTVDQGTDTDKIYIEVCVPMPMTGSIDQEPETVRIDIRDQVTEMESGSPPRPRANSMERGTITETIITQDQTTETAAAERVNQVTETEGETVTDHPQRPRASSVDRGTETERVNTVDRVTETEAAQRTDQETETERERQPDNNRSRDVETETQVRENEDNHREDVAGSESTEDRRANESVQTDSGKEVCAESSAAVVESTAAQTIVSDVSQNEENVSSVALEGEKKIELTPRPQQESKPKESVPLQSVETEIVEKKQDAVEIKENKGSEEEETVCVTIKEIAVTDTVVVTASSSVLKTEAPVRPQRGRKVSSEQVQTPPAQPQAVPVRPRRGSSEAQAQSKTPPDTPVGSAPQLVPQPQDQVAEPAVKAETPMKAEVDDQMQPKMAPKESQVKQPPTPPPADTQIPPTTSSEVQVRPKTIQSKSQMSASRRDSKDLKAPPKGSGGLQGPRRGSGEVQSRTSRQASTDQPQSSRRSSGETQPPPKDSSESQSLRRGSSEAGQRRGSSEAQASRRDSGENQPPRRGSGESPTSPAALGQVVTRLTGLLGEQWAQLGSGSGAQQTSSQQESPSTLKQQTGKKVEAGKGMPAKPAGKTVPAAATGKPTGKAAGKPAASKMSSIQSQLVSSLSVLSAFYSPAQKAAAASKQQEQAGLKSIMKKNGVADKQGNKGAKKNLKFVGVNGGYETTSSEESSGDEKSKGELEQDDSSEPEVEKEKEKETEEVAETQRKGGEESAEGGDAVAEEKEVERGLMDPEDSQELLEEAAEREKVDKGFLDACVYVKDRMGEVSSPDKEMRQVLVVLYKEWFRVSSQKESQADMVRLYLRHVGLTTPTLLPYVVNLTDGNGNMALHYSVSHSNFPVVRLLLDTGLCETNNVNKAGYTPVMLAALTAAESPDDLEVAQQLLKLGDVNARSRQAGQTALMLAVSHGRVAMVKLLLGCGADVNAQDREGSTALMCASEHGHTHIAQLLLETGRCDVTLTDKNGQTAQAVAEASSHQDIIDLLKDHALTGVSEPVKDLL